MFLIQPQLTRNWITSNEGLNNLIEAIDRKIGIFASVEYQNLAFGISKYVNYEVYEKLCEYKEILLDKLLGCNCLNDVLVIDITSRIQTLLEKN